MSRHHLSHYCHSKYRRNIINIRRNTGRLPFNLTSVPALATIPHSLLEKRENVPLTRITDLGKDIEWLGSVDIGTPPTTFRFIDFDTGSADFWVASSDCNSCGNKTRYNPSSSSTSSKTNGTFSIKYIDKSSTTGPIYNDTGEFCTFLSHSSRLKCDHSLRWRRPGDVSVLLSRHRNVCQLHFGCSGRCHGAWLPYPISFESGRKWFIDVGCIHSQL